MSSPVQVSEATLDTFDELVGVSNDELVVVDFWGPQCPNCEAFAAAVPALLEGLRGAPVRIVKVNAYAHDGLARRYGLAGIPTFLLFRGGKLLGRMSQYYGRDYWLGVVRDHLPASADYRSLRP